MGLLDENKLAEALRNFSGLLSDAPQNVNVLARGLLNYVPTTASIYSTSDSIKRRAKDFISNPSDYINQVGGQLVDNTNVAQDAYRNALYNPTPETARSAYDASYGAIVFAPIGMISKSGNFSKKALYPENLPANVVTPVMNSLPASNLYDAGGMFSVEAAANGKLRKLEDGSYLATLDPNWMSKSKPFYAIGNDPEELIAKIRSVATNSDKAITAARTAQVPKDVRTALETQFGKNFSYDISNAANSNSYYITHKPTGTKIRVSDHDLPSYYENTANIDIRPDEVGNLPAILADHLGYTK